MPGEVALDQGRDLVQAVGMAQLLQLHGVQETGQGVGQLQGAGGVQRMTETGLVLGHQLAELETSPQGTDRGRQAQRHLAGFERWLALIQVPQGPDLGQQQGLAARHGDERLRQ